MYLVLRLKYFYIDVNVDEVIMYLGKIKKIVLVLGNGFDLDLGLKLRTKIFGNLNIVPKHILRQLFNI